MADKFMSPIIRKILSSSRSPEDDSVIYVEVESDDGQYNIHLPADTARSLLRRLEVDLQRKKK